MAVDCLLPLYTGRASVAMKRSIRVRYASTKLIQNARIFGIGNQRGLEIIPTICTPKSSLRNSDVSAVYPTRKVTELADSNGRFTPAEWVGTEFPKTISKYPLQPNVGLHIEG